MSTELDRIATKAKADRKVRFTSLAHLLTPVFLRETWALMNRRGASGVDGETTKEFESEIETRVLDIYERLKAGRYKAPPVLDSAGFALRLGYPARRRAGHRSASSC